MIPAPSASRTTAPPWSGSTRLSVRSRGPMSSQPFLALVFFALLCLVASPSAQRSRPYTAPETFSTQLQGRSEVAAAAASMKIHIDRYTADNDRKTISEALAHGGY